MFSVFKNINKYAGRWRLLDDMAVFCARYLIYAMPAFLFVYYILKGKADIFFFCLISGSLSAFILARIIYIFYKEQRPAELKSSRVLIPVPNNPSFPSSHASFAFGFSFLLLAFNLKLALLCIFLSCLIGIARVFCGVHWARDIAGGAASGLISAIIVNSLI
jgi:undecaprenyl-diphosphatase